MNVDKTQDKKLLGFFMGDDLQLDEHLRKKPFKKDQKTEKKQDIEYKDGLIEDGDSVKENIYETKNTKDVHEGEFEEVDYAILKSVFYGFKTNKEIAKALKIRSIVVEKHIYKLLKGGFMKYFQYAVLTSKGKDAITDFEKNNSEDVWKPIDEYIVSIVQNKKEQNLKTQKTIDIILLICIIILIVLIIYFGIFY